MLNMDLFNTVCCYFIFPILALAILINRVKGDTVQFQVLRGFRNGFKAGKFLKFLDAFHDSQCVVACAVDDRCSSVTWMEDKRRCRLSTAYRYWSFKHMPATSTFWKRKWSVDLFRHEGEEKILVEAGRAMCEEMGFTIATLDQIKQVGAAKTNSCQYGLLNVHIVDLFRHEGEEKILVEAGRAMCEEMGFTIATLDQIKQVGAAKTNSCQYGLLNEGYTVQMCPLLETKSVIKSSKVWCSLNE